MIKPSRVSTTTIARRAMMMPRIITSSSGISRSTRARRRTRTRRRILKTTNIRKFPVSREDEVHATMALITQVSNTMRITRMKSNMNQNSLRTDDFFCTAMNRMRISTAKKAQKTCAITWKKTAELLRRSSLLKSMSTAIQTALRQTMQSEQLSKRKLRAIDWNSPVLWYAKDIGRFACTCSCVNFSRILSFSSSASAKMRPGMIECPRE
mmetsp:Transcript_90619/g.256626  ORF Transcript_90619/g.256626 Transcript_90619/m.256626 type:complete len:210 (-) Transcript_90619:454-1083(-)